MSETPGQNAANPQFASKKSNNGCLKAAAVIGGLFTLLLILAIAAAIAGSGGDDDKKKEEAASTATCAGKTYPDQQEKDVCADAAGKVGLGCPLSPWPGFGLDRGRVNPRGVDRYRCRRAPRHHSRSTG